MVKPLSHGGGLLKAAQRYGIPSSQWLDLSTGISPWSYPVPPLPQAVWQRLPEVEDELLGVAQHYYGCSTLLPVAGSQAAIMAIPQLLALQRQRAGLPVGTVALPKVGYKEHEAAWSKAGWQIVHYLKQPDDAVLVAADVLLVINPNNPQGSRISASQLLLWHQVLINKGGTLLVDEAFMDCTPQHSILRALASPLQLQPAMPDGFIILRSVGKFFGLAGIRLGFVCAQPELLALLEQHLGPWSVSSPARWAGRHALADAQWQQRQQQRLTVAGKRLAQRLFTAFGKASVGCCLFQTLYVDNAVQLHTRLCQQGILTRLTDEKDAVRFGLPADNTQWQRLHAAIDLLTTHHGKE